MMSPTWTGARKVISSIAAVTAGPPLCRWATAPAVDEGELHDLAAVHVAEQVGLARGGAMIPRLTRLYDVGRGAGLSVMGRHGSVTSHG